MKQTQQGFTLIELMVAVVVVAILAKSLLRSGTATTPPATPNSAPT